MRERFTENAEKVLKLAKKAAKNNGNGYIGSEHLLLGLLEEGEGTAAILLKESGADTVKIRTLVANLITSEGDTLTEETDYTPRTEIILENAVHEADFFHMEKVGTEHLLLGLIKEGTGVAAAVLAEHDVTEERVMELMERLISPAVATQVEGQIEYTPGARAVLQASYDEAVFFKAPLIGTEHILIAIIKDGKSTACRLLNTMNVNIQKLYVDLMGAMGDDAPSEAAEDAAAGRVRPEKGNTPNLDNFSRDLTQMARDGKLDPVIGREREMKRVIQILSRRTKNNPCLIGEPGVGKTAVVEGLAQFIVSGNVPETIAKKRVVSLDLSGMVAGSKYRGEFEERIKNVISEVTEAENVLLFIDEIHRFNKGQQDYLLPFVEDGTIILIGATTENPYFEVNGALLSRSIIFELKSLEKEDIKTLILRAVNDTQKGMGAYHAVIDEDALDFLADISNGDARAALTAVELGILTTERSGDGLIHITLSVASECIQKRVVKYDKSGDNHYDTVSAFIKSMRGSDPDAAVYYLARMLYAGEDIKFIARRIMICASEDVSNADPMALVVATSAAQAVERIGMPEAQIILAQAVTYVASAPKSNSAVTAISEAMETVKNTMTAPVPPHLQDAHYKSSSKLGHGVGYKYAHDYPNHYVEQQYLPDGLTGRKFYRPSENGYEKQIREYFHKIKGEYSHE